MSATYVLTTYYQISLFGKNKTSPPGNKIKSIGILLIHQLTCVF